MDELKIAALPFGFCAVCIEKFFTSRLYRVHALSDGTKLVECYCEHRECGGTLLLKDGRPQYWRLLSPVDVLRWSTHVAHEIGARRAIAEVSEAPPAPDN